MKAGLGSRRLSTPHIALGAPHGPSRGGQSLPLPSHVREKRFSLIVIVGVDKVPSSLWR